MYDKEHGRFHNRHRKEALWAEISAELKLQPFDIRREMESSPSSMESSPSYSLAKPQGR